MHVNLKASNHVLSLSQKQVEASRKLGPALHDMSSNNNDSYLIKLQLHD